ncbi:MAG: sulfatase, partial [Acidobacteriota bacterium]|nr:sulfatase [Acidobacteriota bacterium]
LQRDLLEDLPGLQKNVETRAVDLASEDAGARLVRGFSAASWDADRERHFVRGVGRRSVVRFALLEAADLELVLQGRPIPRAAAARVEIAVNKDVLDEIGLKPRLGRYRVKVPASAVHRGDNLLYLTYSGAADTVAWYTLQFSPGTPVARAPATNLSARTLFLPYGSQMIVPLLAPPAAEIRFRQLGVRGGRGRLKVDIQRDGVPDRTFEETQTADNIAYDLELRAWTPVRLTLTALADEAAAERDGIALVEPGVWAPERYLPAAARVGDAAAAARRPNVIVYLVDTLRADRIGAYGYERPISPAIDAFAERATLFENAVAQTSWTRPAVATLFTGMWPAAHRVNRGRDQLADGTRVLAEVLKEAGYETMAFVANPNVYRRFGLGQGFDYYRHMPGKKPPSDQINLEVAAWLDQRATDRPFFLYVHTVDPHDPYEPPESYRHKFAPGTDELLALPKRARWSKQHLRELSDLYDAEIAFNDSSFGELVDHLESRGLWQNSMVIFLSDHGEEFQEHGSWTHGRTLFDESIKIPLIVKWPGQRRGERRQDLAQQIDVPASILGAAGLAWPQAFEGRDLAQSATDSPPTAFTYLNYYGPLQLAAVREDWKYLVRVERRSAWLFDRGRDPKESQDFSQAEPVRSAVFDALLEGALRPQPYWLLAGEAEIDEELE